MKPVFITFEGGEGAGKSTQIGLLADHLRSLGHDVVTTREPGGSPDADTLRELLVTGEPGRWSPQAEALLNYAARESHLNHLIRPSLATGKTVLCDRFADSTRAYQGIAGEVGTGFVEMLDEAIVGRSQPDLTLIFDLDPKIGLERAQLRGGADRFEKKGLRFHQALREAFLEIAENHPVRCRLIDASGSVEEVAAQIRACVEQSMGKLAS
jgi:dTMP kinase